MFEKGIRKMTTDSWPAIPSVTIEAADFGPIARAHIDLRPLTVFVGPSNTGKSYMAMLIYALHRFVSGPHQDYVRPRRRLLPQSAGTAFPPVEVQDVLEWVDTVLTRPSRVHAVPPSVAKHFHSRLTVQPRLPKALADEVRWCLGLRSATTLTRRKGGGRAEVMLHTSVPIRGEPPAKYSYQYALESGKESVTADVPQNLWFRKERPSMTMLRMMANRMRVMLDDEDQARELKQRAHLLLDVMADSVFRLSLGPLGRSAHYLPADRTGIMHAHSVVVRSLINQASHAGIRQPESLPMFSGVLADFLEQLIDLPRRGPTASFNKLANELESKMLGGRIILEESEVNYPSYHYRPRGWKSSLPLLTSSSMVSELAPIVLFLKHVVRKNEVLIIEEPESHLHPAMQVRLAQFLAKIVQRGIRVIVTTHSEVVLETLANVTAVGQLPEDARQGLPASETALPPDDVGVWLFTLDETEGGSTVQEIGLDEGGGTYPVGYDKVNEALYNDWADILDRREGG